MNLEDIMGLYGQLGAPGAEDEMRRTGRRAGGGGYEGIGGNLVSPGMFAPFMGGQAGPGFSGAIGRDFQQGSGGLAQLVQQLAGHGQGMNDFQGPAFRNFTNQGFDFNPPGQNNQNPIGGPNIAPGNIDNAQALNQPMGPGHVPGVPQGVAVGQQPGRTMPMPQTQGWRNVHPGYSAAAQAGFGTPEWGGYRGTGPVSPPGGVGVGGPGGNVQAPGGGGGGGGGGAEQVAPRPGTNVSGVQQQQGGGGGGGGSQGTAGGGGGGGKKVGGGQGGGGGGQGGPTPAPEQRGQGPVTSPGNANQVAARSSAREGRQEARSAAFENAQNISESGRPTTQADASGLFGDTINVGPERPEQRGQGPISNQANKLAGMSAQEKVKAKATWQDKVAAKQERRADKAVARAARPSSGNTGTGVVGAGRGAAGVTTPPPPKVGKTKPKTSTTPFQRGQR